MLKSNKHPLVFFQSMSENYLMKKEEEMRTFSSPLPFLSAIPHYNGLHQSI
jgi:hypothetical protein